MVDNMTNEIVNTKALIQLGNFNDEMYPNVDKSNIHQAYYLNEFFQNFINIIPLVSQEYEEWKKEFEVFKQLEAERKSKQDKGKDKGKKKDEKKDDKKKEVGH